MSVRRMDNVGIVVDDIDAAIAFFTELGLTLEGRAPIEGAWAERGWQRRRPSRPARASMRTSRRGPVPSSCDCKAIMAICRRVTKQQPGMWGPSIVGYGSYTYTL